MSEYLEKLKRVAHIFVEQGVFKDFNSAYSKLCLDFSRGYPDKKFVDSLLNKEKSGDPFIVNLDEDNNYMWLGAS